MSYNFSSGEELLIICEKEKKTIWEVMLLREVNMQRTSREEVIAKMMMSLDVMISSIETGANNSEKSISGLIGGEAKILEEYRQSGKALSGDMVMKSVINSMAVLEVNASMGKIVASPTAGSCGILPGSLVTIGIEKNMSTDEIVRGLFTASAIGYLFSKNATVSGAEGGCQAETGTAAAMAAAGLVEMMGGNPEQALSAASFTIKNVLGLVCDPIAGLVECPCQKRNALASANALISADMALAGIKTIIPFDEVVDAMYRVGKLISPTLRETALGGLAVTKTGRKITSIIYG
ncbi:MAG: L-serine ammonia-lyase, iron-sulfur-dependent, subunit alpha [Acidaminobacteraceae bacterium]